MKEPLFLSEPEVLAYHAQQIRLYGGDAGMRDPGLLNSALAQPQNTHLYDATVDLYDIAAAYAFHLTAGGESKADFARFLRQHGRSI